MFFDIRQYLNFTVQDKFCFCFFFIHVAMWSNSTLKIKTQHTVGGIFLRVGEIYISYAVSVKPRKYPRTYGKKSHMRFSNPCILFDSRKRVLKHQASVNSNYSYSIQVIFTLTKYGSSIFVEINCTFKALKKLKGMKWNIQAF